jgi:peptidyl-tRNA hydrolase, PTH1 family
MGLFERRSTPITSTYYSISDEHTKLVIGLGNIGKQYDFTRHNAGFLCIDHLVKEQDGVWKTKKALKCELAEIRLGDKRVLCIKPTTLMNLSGDAVAAVKKFYKLQNKDILVVHDELALPYGSLRLRLDGSSAGHNGIKSVSAAIGEDYARLRIGIANALSPKSDSADFVLKPFNKTEQETFPQLYKETVSLINEFVHSDELLPDTRKFI